MSDPLTPEELTALYDERTAIEAWLDPTPDPTVWPPVGWAVHPQDRNLLFRVVTEAALREELFGSPQKTQYTKDAQARLAVIDETLTAHFFPKPKDEGVQRKTKDGFITSLKTGIKRAIDIPTLAKVILKCPKGTEDKVIEWKASLKVKEWRDLSEKTAAIFADAIIETPEKPKFEIVRKVIED